MKKYILLFLLFATYAHAQSGEIFTGGRTTEGLIVQDESTNLPHADYLDFTGSGVAVTSDGQTYSVSISGGSGSSPSLNIQLSGNSICTGATCDTVTYSNDFDVSETSSHVASIGISNITVDTVSVDTISTNGGQVTIGSNLQIDGNTTLGGTFHSSGYNMLLTSGTTLVSADCDNASEAGRVFVDTDATSGQQWYVCEGLAGWVLQGGGTTLINNLGDADGDGTVALAGNKQTWTSTLNTEGANLKLTNTTADLTNTVSFIDLVFTDTNDLDGYYLRGYGNAGADMDFYIGPGGAASFDTVTANSFVANPSPNPTSKYNDSDDPENSDNGIISLNCPNVTTDAQNCELTLSRMVAGATVDSVVLGNTGGVTIDTLTISGGPISGGGTDTKCVWIAYPTLSDDLQSIIVNKTSLDWTLTEMWGESDQSVTFGFLVDDGTPAPINGLLTPNGGEAEDTSLTGDTVLGAGEELDLQLDSTSGTPTRFSACVTYTY